jgi:hypothetical protein
MSNYTQSTDFSAKDALPTGDSGKLILGADMDTEFGAISTAIASKLDNPSTESAKANISVAGASAFYATPTSDQTFVVSGTNTKVIYPTEVYDLGSDYDTANSRFVAGETGYYLFTATVQTLTNLTDGILMFAWFRKNGGTELAGVRESTSGTTFATLNLSWVGKLTATDYIEVWCRHQLGSDVTLDSVGSFASMHFSGARIA